MSGIVRPEKFRILIIGRANAGKTTILRAVCGAEGEPDVYDQDGNKVQITPEVRPEEAPAITVAENEVMITQRSARSKFRMTLRSIRARLLCGAADLDLAPDPQVVPTSSPPLHLGGASNSILSPSSLRGEHNIEYSLMFPNNPGFIFHDSRGFESGAVEELDLVREFIRKKANLGSMKNQLHAIWYCFSADNNRFMTAADKVFFNTIDTGTVPVIAIFTKFDALDAGAFSALSEQGVPFAEAQKRAPEHAQEQFNQGLLPLIKQLAHPPKAVVCLRNMNKGSPAVIQKAASELIESTGATLDDGALKVLLIQAQHVNVELCMKAAVDSGVITKAAQSAIQEDPATFNPLQKELIKEIFKWFPYIWVSSGSQVVDYSYSHALSKLGLSAVYWKGEINDAAAADAFINAITPHVSSHLQSMLPPLQILCVGCAAVIIAAKAFWMHPGDIQKSHITASSVDYIQSGTAEHVRVAISKAFQDMPGLYGTSKSAAALLEIVLSNQISHAANSPSGSAL
ncbi:hypothetical protein BOTBODRAFT_32254 [Botryobasidium botryosum FD-172 SS1]|uniref:G domain-containing protein n=1 Tax=Botryobasidium botryosum (strain FD-172 SS1) TaxID=930990 RepID=A0A067MST4_BOTB1|nr:hypothetical protein BOTBODRAFT_32254 [Botryobasidium botryosum FD-172 SS1]